jgi:hypothetical protein
MRNSLVIQQIDTDIAEAERLTAELRFHIALTQSAGGDTSESEARLHQMMKGSMLLRDQRLKAAGQEAILVPPSNASEPPLGISAATPHPAKPSQNPSAEPSAKPSSEDPSPTDPRA